MSLLRTQIGLVLLFLFAAGYVHQTPKNCPTPLSRLDLLHALFVHGTLRIDAYDNTPDKATWEGHSYSDKAPGTTVLALPPFVAGALALQAAGVGLDTPEGWLVSSWVACFGSLTLLTAIGAAVLFAWLAHYVPPRSALIATLAVFLGSAPLPYATMLFSHSLVVACVAIALYAIYRYSQQVAEVAPAAASAPEIPLFRSQRWPLLAGFACGWALASEYTAGLVVVAMLFWLILEQRRSLQPWNSSLTPFFIGAIPPLLLIPLYSWLCFGNPFLLPYSVNQSFPAMREGLYAIKWPDPETAWQLLLGPTRGLFFWTPFLALALVGYRELAHNHTRLFWLTYAVPLLQVVVISGRVWDWQAGPTLGPRYLAPMLPLMALPCALAVKRLPKTGLIIAGVSVVLTAFATFVNASPSGNIHNPLTELHWPALLKGSVQPNLGTALGLPPVASLLLYLAVVLGGAAWLIRATPTVHPPPPTPDFRLS